MYQALVPCPSCKRHIRAAEGACPFCSAAIPEGLSTSAVPSAPRRLSRAAAFVFGATMAVTGCDTETDGGGAGGGTSSSSTGADDDGGVMALYGVPPPDGGPDDDGGGQAEYGAPPPDAG